MKTKCQLIKELFLKLRDNNINYVILRNWENFYDDLLVEGHNDIDILCQNFKSIRKIVRIFNAFPINDRFYCCKYYFFVLGQKIFLDFRFIGDGYYCKKWEKKMLHTRTVTEKGFFVLDFNNYFYSLIYHSLIHKNYISDNYKRILTTNKNNLDFESELMKHMKKNRYYISKPIDKYVGQFNINVFNKQIPYKQGFCTFVINQKIRLLNALKSFINS